MNAVVRQSPRSFIKILRIGNENVDFPHKIETLGLCHRLEIVNRDDRLVSFIVLIYGPCENWF